METKLQMPTTCLRTSITIIYHLFAFKTEKFIFFYRISFNSFHQLSFEFQ